MFEMKSKDIKHLKRFMKEYPREFKSASAGVLNSLAFKTRENDKIVLHKNMIIRNERFLNSSLRVDKAKPSNQVAYAYSVKRQRFTGWEEQQTGKPRKPDRAPTLTARGGNTRSTVRQTHRLKPSNKFYKPEQFASSTKSLKAAFAFMIRVMATRGGGDFLLSKEIPIKSGMLKRGLYEFKNHKIKRVQKIDNIKQPKTFRWRDQSLKLLQSRNDIKKIWNENLIKTVNRYK